MEKCKLCIFAQPVNFRIDEKGLTTFDIVCMNGVTPEDEECVMNGKNIVIFKCAGAYKE